MCLYVNPDAKAQTAETDITVYKVLSGNCSPYKDFRYKPNTLHRLRKALVAVPTKFTGRYFKVERGFHTFQNAPDAIAWMANKTDDKKRRIVILTIPKGAKYIKGIFGVEKYPSIVSSSIRTGELRGAR